MSSMPRLKTHPLIYKASNRLAFCLHKLTIYQLTHIMSLINRAACKAKLVEHAADTRYYWGSVVGRDGINVRKDTLDQIEAVVSAWIRGHVEQLPSKGKTI